MKFTSKIQPQARQQIAPESQPEASPPAQKIYLAQARLNARQSEAQLAPNRTTRIHALSYEDTQQKIVIPPREGVTKVSPITIFNNSRGGKSIRARLVGDELASQALERGKRPSRQAIKMANALRVERILDTGRYRSIRELAERTKISRNTLAKLLNTLNQGVGEIEVQLFEMR